MSSSIYLLFSFLALFALQGCNSTPKNDYFTESQVVSGNLGSWNIGENRRRTATSETERFVSSDRYKMTGVHFSMNIAQKSHPPGDLYKRMKEMWEDYGQDLVDSEKMEFDRRMQLLNQMRLDLEQALKLKGSQVFSLAEKILIKTANPTILAGASYAENIETLSPFEWAIVAPLNSFSQRRKLQNKNGKLPSKDRFKLLSLIQKWNDANTYPEGIDSVGDLANTLASLDVYGGKGVHNLYEITHPMLNKILQSTLDYTVSNYKALGQKNLVKLEQVMAQHAPFESFSQSLKDMQYLVNTYSYKSDAFATIAWQEQSYKRLENDNALKVLNLTTAALTPQNTQTLQDIYQYLEQRNLIATKALLHLYDDSVQSIYKYKNKPYRSTETLALSKELIVLFDPIWEENSKIGEAYVKRLHDLPWLNRPIYRYFGMSYRGPKNLNLAAKQQGVSVGHLAIVIEDDLPVLRRSEHQDNLSFLLLASDREKVTISPTLKKVEKELEIEAEKIMAMQADLQKDMKTVEFLNKEFNESVKAFERKNKDGEATNYERNQLVERRKQIGYRKIDFNEKSEKFNEVSEAFRQKRLRYNEQVNLLNGKSLTSLVTQQNRILTDWFEQEVERHRIELAKNNLPQDEIELELASLRWILGLDESLPSTLLARIPNQSITLTEVPGYQLRVLEAEEAAMFVGGTSQTIAKKIVQHYVKLIDMDDGYTAKAKKRTEKLVDQYIKQFDHWELLSATNGLVSKDNREDHRTIGLRNLIESAVKRRQNE